MTYVKSWLIWFIALAHAQCLKSLHLSFLLLSFHLLLTNPPAAAPSIQLMGWYGIQLIVCLLLYCLFCHFYQHDKHCLTSLWNNYPTFVCVGLLILRYNISGQLCGFRGQSFGRRINVFTIYISLDRLAVCFSQMDEKRVDINGQW